MLLERLPDSPDAYAMVQRWLGFLLQHMNHGELSKLLEYYTNIGWISKEVQRHLNEIAQGIKSSGTGTWQVPSRVHLTSLLFIVHLSGRDMPRELYSAIAYSDIYTGEPETVVSI